MNPEKGAELFSKYPKIFVTKEDNSRDTPFTFYGFECDDGWYILLDTLCHSIQHHVDWKTKSSLPEEIEDLQPIAQQVKSKFGGLRFYFSGGDDYISGLVRMAESMSHKICEQCGNLGSHHGKGWIFTLCDPCWEKHPANKT